LRSILLAFAIITLLPLSSRAAANLAPRNYEVQFHGPIDDDLRAQMAAVAATVELQAQPPPALPLLQRRIDRDLQTLNSLLRSRGYYAANIRAELDSERQPLLVRFIVEPGRRYRIGSIEILQANGPDINVGTAISAIAPGQTAAAAAILQAQQQLLQHLGERGFAFAQVIDRDVLVRHASRRVDVTYQVEPGPEMQFGELLIRGLDRVEPAVVQRHLPWQRGQKFRASDLDRLQRRLVDTGLFTLVQVRPASRLDADEQSLPIHVDVSEAKPRSVSLRLGYDTYEELFLAAQWQHRNLFGGGEHLQLRTHASRLVQDLDAILRLPGFGHPDQQLQLRLNIGIEDLEAYQRRGLETTLLLSRQLTASWRTGAGIAFRYSEVEQLGQRSYFSLVSLPLELAWDTALPELNPRRGGRHILQLTPFTSVGSAGISFVRSEATVTRYLILRQQPQLTLAARINFATISGAANTDIPADERLYAGGAASIRGYAFQSVGPTVADNPIGGRSRLLYSLELRFGIRENLSGVVFWDAGSVDSDSSPRWLRDVQHGAGIGLRYETPVGPLRLDFAVPLNRRERIDDPWHIYISVGQAF